MSLINNKRAADADAASPLPSAKRLCLDDLVAAAATIAGGTSKTTFQPAGPPQNRYHRSPALTHQRRYLCTAASRCTSGANDLGGLHKHVKTSHLGVALPSARDAVAVPWLAWARGDYVTHPPTGQARAAFVEFLERGRPTQGGRVVLGLGMRRGVPDANPVEDVADESDGGSDDVILSGSDSPVPQSTVVEASISQVRPTVAPARDDNTSAPSHTETNGESETRGPPASRLRPRSSSPNTARSASRIPPRKPRKPTKESLLNSRHHFQKSRAWQQALLIATASLELNEPDEQPMPTERERVLAKRIAEDQAKLQERMVEIRRLKLVRYEQHEQIRSLRRQLEIARAVRNFEQVEKQRLEVEVQTIKACATHAGESLRDMVFEEMLTRMLGSDVAEVHLNGQWAAERAVDDRFRSVIEAYYAGEAEQIKYEAERELDERENGSRSYRERMSRLEEQYFREYLRRVAPDEAERLYGGLSNVSSSNASLSSESSLSSDTEGDREQASSTLRVQNFTAEERGSKSNAESPAIDTLGTGQIAMETAEKVSDSEVNGTGDA